MPLYNPNLTHQIAGNTAGVTANIATGTYQLAGGNNITLSQNANSVTISAAAGGGGADGANIVAAGTQTANTTGTVVFSNSNNVSFGMSNSSIVTASASFPAQTNQNNSLYALGNTTQNSSTVLNASALSFNALGAATMGYSNGSIQVSVPAQTVQTQNMVSVEGSTGNIDFANANGITFGFNASTITASHNGLTSQSNQNITAANGGFAFQTLSFSNLNGMSFGTSAGSAITGSYTVPTVTQYFSATNTTFNGTNISGSVTLNTNGLRIDASVAAPGAAAENNWVHALGANTAGNTTASGSTIGYSGINLTISGTNGSVMNLSAPATSSLSATGQVSISTDGSTISIGVPNKVIYSQYMPFKFGLVTQTTHGNGTLVVYPIGLPNMTFDRVIMHIYHTNSSNSSGSHTIRASFGVYTRNASTISLLTSATISTAVTHSGTVGSYSLYSSVRNLMIPITSSLSEGEYWLAFVSSTSSAGANGSYSFLVNTGYASSLQGEFGSSNNNSRQLAVGLGIYSTSTTALPGSIGFSQLHGSNPLAQRYPIINFLSGTV